MSYAPNVSESFRGPASSQGKWVSQDCRTLLRELKKNVDTIFDRALKRKNARKAIVAQEFEKRKAGGLLDKITSGPLAEYQDRVKSVAVNAQENAKNNQSFLDKYTSYLDLGATYAGMTSDLVSGVVGTVVDEMAVVNQLSEAAGFGELVPSGQQGSCNNNILVGTVDTLVRVAKNTVSMAAQQLFTAQTTLGLALQAVPDMYSAIMSMPAGTLSVLLTNKGKILDRVVSVVQHVVTLARSIQAADYPTDHRRLISGIMSDLSDADNDLGVLEQVLSAGGKFLTDNWKRAEATVSASGDTLLRAESRFPTDKGFVKMLQMLGYQKDIETLIKVMSERQSMFAQFVGLIGDFSTNFKSASNFKNLAGPLVQQVRCMLSLVTGDMDKTLDTNSLVRYFLKEKQWGVELVQIAVLMQSTGAMGASLAVPSTEINVATDRLSKEVSENSASFIQSESYTMVAGLLANFVKAMRRKVATNSDPEILAGMADAIISETVRMRSTDDGLSKLLAGFNNSFASQGLVAAQAVAGLAEVFDARKIGAYYQALMKGDWKTLLGLDALKSQLESHTRQIVGDLLQCCHDNAGDGDAATRLMKMNDQMLWFQRQKDLYERYTGGFIDRYVRLNYATVIPAYKAAKADVARISRSTCINKGAASSETMTGGLTLL